MPAKVSEERKRGAESAAECRTRRRIAEIATGGYIEPLREIFLSSIRIDFFRASSVCVIATTAHALSRVLSSLSRVGQSVESPPEKSEESPRKKLRVSTRTNALEFFNAGSGETIKGALQAGSKDRWSKIGVL